MLNGQDQAVAEMVARLGVNARKLFFSSRGRQTVTGGAADIYVMDGRIYTTMIGGGGETEVMPVDEIPLRGMHNVENVMTSLAAVFCAMGTQAGEVGKLREAVRRFKGVEHRIEYVAEIAGVKFYNDSKATNVDSTIKALEAFDGNLILILGGKDKGSDYSVLRELVGERVKQVVLLGAASDKIAEQLEGARPMTRATSMEDAVVKSMEAAGPGDTVLLAPACASFDMFDNYEHRGRVFKEEVFRLANRLHSGWTGRLTT